MASALGAGAIAGLMGLGSGLSFGGNIVTSAVNSRRAWKYTERAMRLQDQLNRDYTEWNLINSPSYARQGYVNAGYNPLLALGSNMSSNGAIYSGAGINSDSDNGSQAVTSAVDMASLANTLNLGKSQADNINADTDIKKYGTKGAILKNLVNLAKDNSDNPEVQKLVDSQIVGVDPSFRHSAIDSQFFREHPTTYNVLRKLRQGDFKGAKYAIDLRRQRLLKELNARHSSISSLKKTKFPDSVDYANSFNVPSPSDIRRRKPVNHSYSPSKSYNMPPRNFPSGM